MGSNRPQPTAKSRLQHRGGSRQGRGRQSLTQCYDARDAPHFQVGVSGLLPFEKQTENSMAKPAGTASSLRPPA